MPLQDQLLGQATDRTYDILRSERSPLEPLFKPRSVAVIGASEREGSVGRTLLWNLISHPFGGTVYPVNPKRHSVLGIQAYPNLAAIPEPVDLAVIATPAASVPALVAECAAKGVGGAVVLSAGFQEGAALRGQPLRLLGPNCLGLMNPRTGLNATFATTMARAGHVGFLSQSGAICTSVLGWSRSQGVGFSAFASIGSMLDVGWGDLITHLGDDPDTHSIVIYMEAIGDARAFLSAAREVALTKPIVVIKGGRTAQAAQAAASHTGALTGSDAVLEAAFRRCGVLRVDSISDLFDLAELLAKQPRRPAGPRLTVLTNAGGPGVLATDALVLNGGELASLAPATIERLNGVLPPHWSHGNPIDILGDADPERYRQTLEAVIDDPGTDGVLVILTPQAMTDPVATAQHLRELAGRCAKPLVASWMGGEEVGEGEAILNGAGIATNPFPDAAARLFTSLWRYSYNLRGIYETPSLLPDGELGGEAGPAMAAAILADARRQARSLLSEWETKQLLAAYDIPVVDTRLATSADAAVAAATLIGYPVVVKLHSTTLTHKSDVGGVMVNLQDAAAVRGAYDAMAQAIGLSHGADAFAGVTVQEMVPWGEGLELILGSSVDSQFGPVLLFGTGGTLVEVFRDSAVALPPLNTTLARLLMEQTRIYRALQGMRGRGPVDLEGLEQVLVRVSQLVLDHPCIQELDINPLLAAPQGSGRSLVALDARIVIATGEGDICATPRPAIRPYPNQYVRPWQLGDGTPVAIRPIRPEDEPLVVAFHRTLSQESVYFRFFHMMSLSARVAHERLIRICFTDYDREMALVVDRRDPATGEHSLLAVGRLSRLHGRNEAEFSLLVSDPYQHQGLGSELLRLLLQIGRDEGLRRISAAILPVNHTMQRLCEKLGFCLEHTPDEVRAWMDLEDPLS